MTTYTGNCNQSIEKSFFAASGNLVQRLQQWLEIQQLKASLRQERQQLLEMSDAMLKDLGITRSQAMHEAQQLNLPEARSGKKANSGY